MPILGAHRHLDAVEHERLLADLRRRAGRRRREDRVDVVEQLAARARDTSGGISAPVTTSGAGTMAPAISRSRTAGSKSRGLRAQAVEMQRRAFGRGDDIGGGARARRFGDFDLVASRRAPWRRASSAASGLGQQRPSGNSRRRRRCAGPASPASSMRRHRLGRPIGAGRIVGIGALHRVVGQREIARRARERAEMVEAGDERETARARDSRP